MYFRRRDIPELHHLQPEDLKRRFTEANDSDPLRTPLALLVFCLFVAASLGPRMLSPDNVMPMSALSFSVFMVIVVLNETVVTNHRVSRILRREAHSKKTHSSLPNPADERLDL